MANVDRVDLNGNGGKINWVSLASVVISIGAAFMVVVNPRDDLNRLRNDLESQVQSAESRVMAALKLEADKDITLVHKQEEFSKKLADILQSQIKSDIDKLQVEIDKNRTTVNAWIEKRPTQATFDEYKYGVDNQIKASIKEIDALRTGLVTRAEHLQRWEEQSKALANLITHMTERDNVITAAFNARISAEQEARQRVEATITELRRLVAEISPPGNQFIDLKDQISKLRDSVSTLQMRSSMQAPR